MRRCSSGVLIFAAALWFGCSSKPAGASGARAVILPDGFHVDAEVEVREEDMERGMMYRDSLLPGHGMLFVHSQPGKYPYWMANCLIPLDIIWMNSSHQVVEISAGTPPCPQGGESCPTYGGHETAQFVLELGGGEAARHSVRNGQTIRF